LKKFLEYIEFHQINILDNGLDLLIAEHGVIVAFAAQAFAPL
jgi:hypothetical protein